MNSKRYLTVNLNEYFSFTNTKMRISSYKWRKGTTNWTNTIVITSKECVYEKPWTRPLWLDGQNIVAKTLLLYRRGLLCNDSFKFEVKPLLECTITGEFFAFLPSQSMNRLNYTGPPAPKRLSFAKWFFNDFCTLMICRVSSREITFCEFFKCTFLNDDECPVTFRILISLPVSKVYCNDTRAL